MAGARSPGRRIFRGAPPRRDGGGRGPPRPGRRRSRPSGLACGRSHLRRGDGARRARGAHRAVLSHGHPGRPARARRGVGGGGGLRGQVLEAERLRQPPRDRRGGPPDGAGGLSDEALANVALVTLGGMGIEVLDQRPFFSSWMMEPGTLTSRAPSDAEWEEIRAGFSLARQIAGFRIGQTLVRSHGVTLAVEAAEGTDETIRRGARLAGKGAVVIKAVATEHDFRFDVPTVGPTTLEAMAECGATA